MKLKFGEINEEATKMGKLHLLEQEEKTVEEYIQVFKKTARESRHTRRVLTKEFKRSLNGGIRRKLMKSEQSLVIIRKWYERAIVLEEIGKSRGKNI